MLHPTSLPGPDGIGDLGPDAYRWLDFLAESGCGLWQVLPLGPTGFGDSPYQCFSAFAGNPYLISNSLLYGEGLLRKTDLDDRPAFPAERADYGAAIPWKLTSLHRAYLHFLERESAELRGAFESFVSSESSWLEDFALFMAIKATQGGASWERWPEDLRRRDAAVLAKFSKEHARSIDEQRFDQFLFFRQWEKLRDYARERGITIIGDIPIFVAYDSADTWAHPELFMLNEEEKPAAVAGVPPDYFSKTGQLWGNPLYRWETHEKQRFAWWIERVKSTLKLVDIIRLDHFRGFCGYWEIPAGMPTAEVGRWAPGPGKGFFDALNKALGDLPFIAEDLGFITPDVVALRDELGLPGMKIFQFAFATDPKDPFLPHNYSANCVAYTGTHDNDTARGWFETAPETERTFCLHYLDRGGENISWDMIRAVWSSVAVMSVAPLQDFLSLDSEGRMNFPGKPSDNWTWRFTPAAVSDELAERIYELGYLYDRLNPLSEPKRARNEEVASEVV